MKIIMSIMLIIVMGVSNHKENTMPIDEGNRATIKLLQQKKPPAWLGKQPTAFSNDREWDQTPVTSAPMQPVSTTAPRRPTEQPVQQQTVWDIIRQRLNNSPYLNPSGGLGGGNAPVPNFNTPQTITSGQQQYSQTHQSPRPLAAPAPRVTPAWMQAISQRVNTLPYLGPAGGFGSTQPVPNFNTPQSITEGQQGNDGNVYNNNEPGVTDQGTPTFGTGSFIAGGGEAVLGPNGAQAYYPWSPMGVNTFIGAGGQAVRGPNEMAVAPANPGNGGNGGYGFGTGYGGNWRRGGGGGGGGGYDYGNYASEAPAWMNPYMNLYSLNWKG